MFKVFFAFFFFFNEANFNFFGSFENPFRLDSVLRARIEMRSSISERLQQCSQRLCDVVVPNPYCFYDYLKQKKPMPMADQHSPPFPDFPNLTSFKSPDQQSDFLQVLKQPFFLSSLFYYFILLMCVCLCVFILLPLAFYVG